MDRQEAALTMMAVPEGELLIAEHDIAGVIDVQHHRCRWRGIRDAPTTGAHYPVSDNLGLIGMSLESPE
jgi:hypothetical protein